MKEEIRKSLIQYFGHHSLRAGQDEVIEKVLDGMNTLAVLPTGGGKSLCYQLPAVVGKGLTIVISPLIALMKDQVDALQKKGVPAIFWNSSEKMSEGDLLEKISSDAVKLLYLSPERFVDSDLWGKLKAFDINLIAVDEAHCVSEWGHSFRPAYLTIAKKIRRLKPRCVLALTATASPQVASEIRKSFRILKRDQVQTSFYRSNLCYRITPCRDDLKKNALLESLTKKENLPAVVYAIRRDTVEDLAAFLRDKGFSARAFHAGMNADAKAEVQDAFLNNQSEVICATIAFGMGIDKSDVRSVMHYQPPKSLEGWMQESGRAGRDGNVSQCELLISENDRSQLESFCLSQKPTLQAVSNIISNVFSQGERAVISRYDLSTMNDVSHELLAVLLVRLELQGWIAPEQGSWLWCHAVPLEPIEKILYGFKPAQQKILRPILQSRKKVSLRELSGNTVAGQIKLMSLLAELNTTGDVKMNFSHSLDHFRIKKVPENISQLAKDCFHVIETHTQQEIKRISSVFEIATSQQCIAISLLQYFGEKLESQCGCCSSCLGDARPKKLPQLEIPSVTEEEMQQVQMLTREKKPTLATAERLARFLCGIYSPAMMRYRLSFRKEWGMLKRLPFEDVLAYTQSLNI